jgi:hypothetical protein
LLAALIARKETVDMAKMGNGYGSEFHLLRYLGYHRSELNRAIQEKTGGRVVEWLDFAFRGEGSLDREWKGLDFVDPAPNVKSLWANFWPQTGNVPNWDAVGRLESNSTVEYLLVEAKAHVEELHSSCGASKKGGLSMIQDTLEATIRAHNFTADVDDWLRPYYQYANRLAHLHFLLKTNIPTRLVFIYFCGDNWGDKKLPNGSLPKCPRTAQQWDEHVKAVHQRLGMSGKSELEERVHSLFLHV